MHKIYFEKRCIIICSPEEEALADPNSVEFHVGEKLNIHALVRMFEVQDTLSRIYIPTDNIENTYRRICTEFKEVNAAGGLVSNRRGDYLLISRNGLHLHHGPCVLPAGAVAPQAHLVVRHALHRPHQPYAPAGGRHHQSGVGGQKLAPAFP